MATIFLLALLATQTDGSVPADALDASSMSSEATQPQDVPGTLNSDEGRTKNFAMTISGGVSLGAYEAGMNWAFVKLLRRFRDGGLEQITDGKASNAKLVALTGASAGNLNAFLSSAAWCRALDADGEATYRQATETVENNPFYDFWITLGLTQLMPRDSTFFSDCLDYKRSLYEECDPDTSSPACQALEPKCNKREEAWQPDDGLFSRYALENGYKRLGGYFGDGGFDVDRCNIPVGITLTRAAPLQTQLGQDGRNISIPVQRVAVPLRVDAVPAGATSKTSSTASAATTASTAKLGNLRFRWNAKLENDAQQATPRGQHIKALAGEVFRYRLDKPAEHELEIESMLHLIKAAAAFPVAFGPVMLEDVEGRSAQFMDGGTLDNVPVGLLASEILSEEVPDPNSVGKIYMQPMALRNTPEKMNAVANRDDQKSGIAHLAVLGQGIWEVANTYELQLAKRFFDGLGLKANIHLSSRFAPIFGSHLINFEAFFHKMFRVHDYYVGVYDATYNAAEELCLIKYEGDPEKIRRILENGTFRTECVVEHMPLILDLLKTRETDDESKRLNERLDYVFHRMRCLELGGSHAAGATNAHRMLAQTACKEADKYERDLASKADVDVDSLLLQAGFKVNRDYFNTKLLPPANELKQHHPTVGAWLEQNDFDVAKLMPIIFDDAQCRAVLNAGAACTANTKEQLKLLKHVREATEAIAEVEEDIIEITAELLDKANAKTLLERCAGEDGENNTTRRPRWERQECTQLLAILDRLDRWRMNFAKDALWRLEEVERRNPKSVSRHPHGATCRQDHGARWKQSTTAALIACVAG